MGLTPTGHDLSFNSAPQDGHQTDPALGLLPLSACDRANVRLGLRSVWQGAADWPRVDSATRDGLDGGEGPV